MQKEREAFIVRHEFDEPLAEYSDAMAGKLFKALMYYSIHGVDPEITGKLRILYKPMRNVIMRDKEKYEETCKLNRSRAQKRWEKEAAAPVEEEERSVEVLSSEVLGSEPVEKGAAEGEDMAAREMALGSVPGEDLVCGEMPEDAAACRRMPAHADHANSNSKSNSNSNSNCNRNSDSDSERKRSSDPERNGSRSRSDGMELSAAPRGGAVREDFSASAAEPPQDPADDAEESLIPPPPRELNPDGFPYEYYGRYHNIKMTKGEYAALAGWRPHALRRNIDILTKELYKGKTFESSHRDVIYQRIKQEEAILKNVKYD